MKKTILKNAIILVTLPVAGLFLMLIAHLLPVDKMKSNVASSADTITKEFEDSLVIDGYNATLTGNFTDSLMLEFAIYDSPHSVIEQIMHMYIGESNNADEWWPGVSLVDYLNGKEQKEVEYSRYWHGYLVILKPLLMFLSFNSVRLLNSVLQLSLLAICLIALSNKGYSKIAISLAVSMPFMFFFSSFASLSLSICIYLLLLEMLLIAFFFEKFKKYEGFITFFILFGSATAFFDFLTYPVVTLAIPMCAFLAFNEEDKLKNNLLIIFKYSLSWGIGYLFMWASKWIIATIFTKNNTITDALNTVSLRTSDAPDSGRIKSYFECLKLNLSPFANRAFACAFVLILIYIVVNLIVQYKNKKQISFERAIPVLVIALIPFAWWFVCLNHSSEHWMFTCRNFSIFVFAVMCAFSSCTKKNIEKTE